MKIITFMKMTGKFWSSFFYEQTLYNLIVKRDNPYIKQKKKLLESLVYKNTNKINKVKIYDTNEKRYGTISPLLEMIYNAQKATE